MGVTNLYYLDGVDLASANSVYSNAALSILAPDGWYSADGIVREQVGGVLQPAGACASCGYPCSPSPATVSISIPPIVEVIVPMNVGSSVGCVRVDILPTTGSFSLGVKAYYGSIFRNAVLENTGAYTGYFQSQSPGQNMTMLYELGSGCYPTPPAPWPNPFIFNQYKVDSLGAANPTGNTVLYNILVSDIISTVTSGSTYTMFIPKTAAANDEIDFYLYGPCVGAYADITFTCPFNLGPVYFFIYVRSNVSEIRHLYIF